MASGRNRELDDDNELPTIIVTVPHATCPTAKIEEDRSSTSHHCDSAAERCAKEIVDRLNETKKCKPILAIGTIPRTTADLNRSSGAATEWRRKLDEMLKSPHVVCLLDVHSFPVGGFRGREFVIMNVGKPLQWHVDLLNRVAWDVPSGRDGASIELGSTDNAIVLRTIEVGVPSVLLEFSESLSEQQIATLCRSIADFVVERFVGLVTLVGSPNDDAFPTYVITVPHATCPPRSDKVAWSKTGNHACDFYGPTCAALLRRAFASRGRRVAVFEAPVPRTLCDMNRTWSRKTEWRRELRRMLSDRPEKYACLIDSHSYPSDYDPWTDFDVVLLNRGRAPTAWQVAMAKSKSMAYRRIKTETSDVMTDIVAEAQDIGVPSILIEFSEKLSVDELEQTCDRVAEYLVDHEPLDRPTALLLSSTPIADLAITALDDEEDVKTLTLYVGQCKIGMGRARIGGRDRTPACINANDAVGEMIDMLADGRMVLKATEGVASVLKVEVSAEIVSKHSEELRPGVFSFYKSGMGTERLAAVDVGGDDVSAVVGDQFDVSSEWLDSVRHTFRRRRMAKPIRGVSIVHQFEKRAFGDLFGWRGSISSSGEERTPPPLVIGAVVPTSGSEEYLRELLNRCTVGEDVPATEFTRRAIFAALACGLGVSKIGEQRKRPHPEEGRGEEGAGTKTPNPSIPRDSEVIVEGETDVLFLAAIDPTALPDESPVSLAHATVAVATLMIREDDGTIVLFGAGATPATDAKRSVAESGIAKVLALCSEIADDHFGSAFSSIAVAVRKDELESSGGAALIDAFRFSRMGEATAASEVTDPSALYRGTFDESTGFFFADHADPLFSVDPIDARALISRLSRSDDVGIALANLKDEYDRTPIWRLTREYDEKRHNVLFEIVEWALREDRIANPGSLCVTIVVTLVQAMNDERTLLDAIAICESFEKWCLKYGHSFVVRSGVEGIEGDDEKKKEAERWSSEFLEPKWNASVLAFLSTTIPTWKDHRMELKETVAALGKGILEGVRTLTKSRVDELNEPAKVGDPGKHTWDVWFGPLLLLVHDGMSSFRRADYTNWIEFSPLIYELAGLTERLGDLCAPYSASICACLFGLRSARGSHHAHAPMIMRYMAARGIAPARIDRAIAETYLIPIILDHELRSEHMFESAIRAVEDPAALELAAACSIGILWERDVALVGALSALDRTYVEFAADAKIRIDYPDEPYNIFGASQPSPDDQDLYSSILEQVDCTNESIRRTHDKNSAHLASLGHAIEAMDAHFRSWSSRVSPSKNTCDMPSLFVRKLDNMLFPNVDDIETACKIHLRPSSYHLMPKESDLELYSMTTLQRTLDACVLINDRSGSTWKCVLTRDAWKSKYAKSVVDSLFQGRENLPREVVNNSWARIPALGMVIYGLDAAVKKCGFFGLLSARSFHEPMKIRTIDEKTEKPTTLFEMCTTWTRPNYAASVAIQKYIEGVGAMYVVREASRREPAKPDPTIDREGFQELYGLSAAVIDAYHVPASDGKSRTLFSARLLRDLAEVLLRPSEVKAKLREHAAKKKEKKT